MSPGWLSSAGSSTGAQLRCRCGSGINNTEPCNGGSTASGAGGGTQLSQTRGSGDGGRLQDPESSPQGAVASPAIPAGRPQLVTQPAYSASIRSAYFFSIGLRRSLA